MALHDAQTGFHDIKQLPEFYPSIWPSILTYLIIALAIMTLGYLLLRRRSKKENVPLEKSLSAEEKAYLKIKRLRSDLESTKVDVRNFSNSISETIRCYLEEVLHFPARELTPREIKTALPVSWRKRFPELSDVYLEEVQHDLKLIFSSCKWISFAKDSEKIYAGDSKNFLELLDKVEKLIENIAALLAKENTHATTKPNEI